MNCVECHTLILKICSQICSEKDGPVWEEISNRKIRIRPQTTNLYVTAFANCSASFQSEQSEFKICILKLLGADHLILGRLWFFFVIKLFSTPRLNVQFFSDLIKSKQFFLSGRTQNNFVHHLFHLILPHHFKFLRCHHI